MFGVLFVVIGAGSFYARKDTFGIIQLILGILIVGASILKLLIKNKK